MKVLSRISFKLRPDEWELVKPELIKNIANNPNCVTGGRYLYVTQLMFAVIITVTGTKEIPTRLDRLEKLFADNGIINDGIGDTR